LTSNNIAKKHRIANQIKYEVIKTYTNISIFVMWWPSLNILGILIKLLMTTNRIFLCSFRIFGYIKIWAVTEYVKDSEQKKFPLSPLDTRRDIKDAVFVRFLYIGTIVLIVHVVVISW